MFMHSFSGQDEGRESNASDRRDGRLKRSRSLWEAKGGAEATALHGRSGE